MSEVTAVPLRPIAKGSLTKLWLGIAVALIFAVLIAFCMVRATVGRSVTESGLQYKVLKAGEKGGQHPTASDVALVNYKGMLTDGTVFDEQSRTPIELKRVIPGWTEGLQLMTKGSKYRFWIPPSLGYGDKAAGPIPPNSTLVFDVELLEFIPASVLQQQLQMQQMQGLNVGAPAPGGVPGHP
jgi:FKBP-type peptidyl-prolyl cis-trans isomerase FkpA